MNVPYLSITLEYAHNPVHRIRIITHFLVVAYTANQSNLMEVLFGVEASKSALIQCVSTFTT